MKNIIKILLLLLMPVLAHAQQHLPDSTIKALKNATNDSLRYRANVQAYLYFEEINRDSALSYVGKTLLLTRKNNKLLLVAWGLASKSYQLTTIGRYAEALKCLLQAFEIAQDPQNDNNSWFLNQRVTPEKNRLLTLALVHHMFGVLMYRTQNTEQTIFHFKEAKRIAQEINNPTRVMLADMNLGKVYISLNKIDSALVFENEAKDITLKIGSKKYLGHIFSCFGDIALKQGNKTKAKQFYYEGVNAATEQNNIADLNWNYLKLTNFYLAEKEKDSSLYFAEKMFATLKSIGPNTNQQVNIGVAYDNLYKSYKLTKQLDSAFKYAGLALAAKDSIYNNRIASLAQFQNLSFKEQLRLQQLEKEKDAYQSTVRIYALLAGLFVFSVFATILYRNNRQKHKANIVLKSTLSNLKSTQNQLIQSEKMASLGELTAGIAHEIQNPLNFVNNFSEVNKDLLEELKAESEKPKAERDEQLEVELINDLIENEGKINHHGKRADFIVKGMLQHSRTSTGEKQETNINILADEFLKLSYYGLRAKDKSFNAELITKFDENLPKVNIVQQDMGRVLLNLFNNAFYAVNQKQKTAGADYKPTVTVSTFAPPSGGWGVTVKDNGNGIPDAIKDKIMQPFFTTKPTGEGTGLGLSLSYDIVVKGHGGTITVDTKEGEFTEFTVTLPVS
jgi:two-component system NtrC family sensor kinase